MLSNDIYTLLPTPPVSHLNQFLTFYKGWVGSDPNKIIPISDDLLAKYVSMVGIKLPVLYVEYLKEFGGGPNPFGLFDDASEDIFALLEYYQEGGKVPNYGALVAVDGLCGGRALVYEDENFTGEPKVFVCWDGILDYPCAENFSNLLFSKAFIQGKFRDQILGAAYHKEPSSMALGIAKLAEMKFDKHWFSDAYQACFSRPDKTMVRIEKMGDRVIIFYSAPTNQSQEELLHVFVSDLDFQPTKWV